nr:integrase [Ruegeria sp. ANG-R]
MRAARLLAVYEQKEIEIVDMLKTTTLAPADAKALLTEALRAELARILIEQQSMGNMSDEDVDVRIEKLEAENKKLRRAARTEDWAGVQALLKQANGMISLSLPDPLSPDLGRQATSLKRRINDVESDVIEGDDVQSASRALLNDHGIEDFDNFVQEPVLLSQAWAQTRANYPTKSMQGNINALERLTLEFFGDIPVPAISKERQKEFFAWEARLPRTQGRSHGKNRFNKDGKKILKATEISTADAHDLLVTEEIRERDDISIAEKRAILADNLIPRRTMTTIKRDRDGLNRMFKSAKDLGIEPPEALSYKEVEWHIAAQAPNDELYVRVTKPKIRMPWTEERLASFLTSPIFTGCASEHRRSKRGPMIIRDATYWVPLVVLTIGSRIEEILLLKRSDIRYRNGHYCFALGTGPEQPGKTEESKRVVPVPQLLLDLGFMDWFHSLREEHGVLLFPEAARRTTSGDVTSAFGKHLRRILDRLDLGDFDEDFYAMRKTLSSRLNSALVSDGQRQAIAGHTRAELLTRKEAGKKRSPKTGDAMPRGLTQAQRFRQIMDDLETFRTYCGGVVPVGHRNTWLHFYATCLTYFPNAGDIEAQITNMAAIATPGLKPNDVRATIRQALDKASRPTSHCVWKDGRYSYKGSTIAEKLGISAQLARDLGLRQVVPVEERKHRKAVTERARQAAQGAATRDEYLAENNASRTKPWLALGIGRTKYYELKKADSLPELATA